MARSIGGIASVFLLFAVPSVVAVLHLTFFPPEAVLPLSVSVWAAVFLGFLTPFCIIVIRHQVRRNRVKLIELFSETFDIAPGRTNLVAFEFVRGKYFADLAASEDSKKLTLADIPRFPMMLHSDWMLLFCSIPFIIFSAFGIFLLFAPLELFRPPYALSTWLVPSVLTSGGLQDALTQVQQQAYFKNVLTVAGLAFAGSYFFSLRLFLSAVAAFDLTPLTFLRAFAHMVLSATLAVVIYRAAPDWSTVSNLASSAGLGEGGEKFDPTAGLGAQWFIVAFGFGFFPEYVQDRLMQAIDYPFKRRLTAVEPHCPIIPLTIIDGIDPVIAFRLEEATIADVQNLATFNPIMLHIETPYGIYETMDWISQAQLCAVTGPERFLLLRGLNIRTILDLEQVVTSQSANGKILASVTAALLADSNRGIDFRKKFALSHPLAKVGSDWDEASIKCLISVMIEDLHVHRLRQIRDQVRSKLVAKATV